MRLKETIGHIQRQKYVGFGLEVIIVDNASSDDTALCAEKLLRNNPAIEFSIVNEPESGLSFARKKGYLSSRYGFLLFCDDDNWLAENYIQLAYNTMSANPKIGILGGLGEAVFESAEPRWFKQYEIDFAVGEQSYVAESLTKVSEVYGAGFTIRKSYLDQLYGSGFKSILSDRKGNQLVSGGDVEFCYLANYFGYEIWYNRKLTFKHYMTQQRLNWDYMKKLYAANGKTLVYTMAYKYFETHNTVPGAELKLPLWLDVFFHKTRAILKLRPHIKNKMEVEGDADVLRYIAMKAEAQEIWGLKGKYLQVFQTIHSYINSIGQQVRS